MIGVGSGNRRRLSLQRSVVDGRCWIGFLKQLQFGGTYLYPQPAEWLSCDALETRLDAVLALWELVTS